MIVPFPEAVTESPRVVGPRYMEGVGKTTMLMRVILLLLQLETRYGALLERSSSNGAYMHQKNFIIRVMRLHSRP